MKPSNIHYIFIGLIAFVGYPMLLEQYTFIKATGIALLSISFIFMLVYNVGRAVKDESTKAVQKEKEKTEKDFV